MVMDGLPMYTVYEHQTDYPDKYVVRLFINEMPTNRYELFDTLAEARAAIPLGLYCLTRFPGDEPHIVEVWF